MKQKLSQEQLAKLSQLSNSTINDIENGLQIPSQLTMMRISRSLGLHVGVVFNLDVRILEKLILLVLASIYCNSL
jgi:transcriptional regulator with XRE-family HTH domain